MPLVSQVFNSFSCDSDCTEMELSKYNQRSKEMDKVIVKL